MEKSTLYDVLSMSVLQKWRTREEEEENYFFQREKELLEKLRTELNEENNKLLSSYSLAVADRMEYLYHNLNIKILNFGIQIGLELERAFREYEEE